MNNKERLKKVIDDDFNMDMNYHKIVSKKEKHKISKITKLVLVPTCFIFVIGMTMFMKKDNLKDDIKKKPNIVPTDNVYINTSSYLGEENRLRAEIKDININELSQEFEFVNSLDIPDNYALSNASALYTSIDKSDNFDLLHDYMLYYINEEDDNDSNIHIAFSKIEAPLLNHNYSNVNENELVPSVLNNTNVYIEQFENNYVATYAYNNINFQIMTTGLSKKQLINLLNSIIK